MNLRNRLRPARGAAAVILAAVLAASCSAAPARTGVARTGGRGQQLQVTAVWSGAEQRREEAWQTAEILILRHQLAALQRRQPRRPNLDWADRALLTTLLSVIPRARRQGLRLLVTPDTILRWHRDIFRRRWAARSMRGRTGRPATRRNIKSLILRLARENPCWGTAGSTVSWPGWE